VSKQDQQFLADRIDEIGMLLFKHGPHDAETIARTTGLGLDRVRVVLTAMERFGLIRVETETLSEMEQRLRETPTRSFVRVRRMRRLRYSLVATKAAA
jgi:predicted transcriptional regulator